MDENFLERIKLLLGTAGWVDLDEAEKYTIDWLKITQSCPIGVARPATVDEVCGVIRLCQEYKINVVPQGGNTGMVLGSVPAPNDGNSLILALERYNAIEHIDPVGRTVTVQAGIVLEQLQNALKAEDLTLPLHLGSGGSAQIGGLISTNAGGCHAHRDGMMADLVLGLEVVLPNGDLWSGNRALIKDNAGYDLKRLFCGAEGTLGVVTRATLRLQRLPASTSTLLLACDTLPSALSILSLAQSLAGPLLSAAEFMHETGLKLLQHHCPLITPPLDPLPTYSLLLEFTAPSDLVHLTPVVDHLIEQAIASHWATDGVVCANESQRLEFWRLREEIPEGQRLHGPQFKHDVSVPVAALPDFIDAATEACQTVMPAVIVNPFGHLADGNVHFNLSPPANAHGEFVALQSQFNAAVYQAALEFYGSIAAEHGLGRSKVALADNTRSPIERELMKRLKGAIDPNNIMNSGVIVRQDDEVPEVLG